MEHHIRCVIGDIKRFVLAPGSYDRARRIAERLDSPRLVSDSRGYLVFSGRYHGTEITVCATGMGGPQVAIAVEELSHMGADTFIRVGSCGAISDRLRPGDLVIATGAYRGDGTGNAYLPIAFPAVPSYEVLRALAEAAASSGVAARMGIDWSSDAFYVSPDEALLRRLKAAGVLSIEMETDTLFLVAQARGIRAGAIFVCDGTSSEVKPAWGETDFRHGEDQAIDVALAATLRLAQREE